MAKGKSTYQKKTTETKTVTYYQKKGTKKSNRCPVCGQFMKKG